ncbi:MAG TPA: FAD-binding oxidoreductase [Kiritimatiellia bacterium]|nr:FAD-binding oxidoreductase [Kiritimatiellia bacterium]HMO98516.1 FAD-binding oxidoreductase [Kiritimatiellia bacterium]
MTEAFKEIMTVSGIRWFGPDVFELAMHREGLPFTPGDCLALFAADGRVSRPYSIASGTQDEHIRFVIRVMPGGVVSTFLASRRPGDAVRVSPPFGWFRPGEHGQLRPYVFLATGTGVAPFLAFLRSHADAAPAAFFYGVRRSADLIEPEWLAGRAPLRLAVSRETHPGAHHGRITELLAALPTLGQDADYYLCGLDAMIDEATLWLESRDVDITRIHRECFFNASYYT